MAKTIKMKFHPGGKVDVTTEGFQGASCKNATEALEKALGLVTKDTPTAEMYDTEQVQDGITAAGE